MTAKDMRGCASQWLRSAKSLELIRQAEIVAADTPRAILLLEDAYQSAMKTYSRTGSGLVEMQKCFRRLRP